MQETGSTVYCPYPGRLGGQCIFNVSHVFSHSPQLFYD